MPGPEDKPFAIPKAMVWEAWRRVKANKGAPGVDGQDLEEFEADLRDNLYKIWNRMSSGSYFPPPVRALPDRARSPPQARQRLPEALGRAEVQAAADRQALPRLVDRAAHTAARPVRPLARRPYVLGLIRRAR
jgi:hypothetical protein